MKLLFEPLVQSHGADFFHVSGTRSKRETIERVKHAFVLVHLYGYG